MKFNSILIKSTILLGLLILTSGAIAQKAAKDTSWVFRSNQITQKLINLEKKYAPEYASAQGLPEYDNEISVPTLKSVKAKHQDEIQLLAKLRKSLSSEENKFIVQDLEILISYLSLRIEQENLDEQRKVVLLNPTLLIFGGLEPLFDKQSLESRRQSAVDRIKKYAGLTKGCVPIAGILQARMKAQMLGGNKIYPSRQRIETELARNPAILKGIAEWCTKYELIGWEEPFALLKNQLESYDKWLSKMVLPKASKDFRLLPQEYALNLRSYGINIPQKELIELAHKMFVSIQEEMKPIAAEIATKRGLPSSDYRFVVGELKKQQVHGDSIIALYKNRLKDVESIILKNQIVSLPARPAIIRLASTAETSRNPAPHMDAPPFLNNKGEKGVFVLPLNMPPTPGEVGNERFDEFTFDAASWTLIAHEARPGHELQFDKMVEEGVSLARALYAFNSTNVEGWGLYSESIIRPYMPLEGQLISLDYRLLRAARAFLDPELQQGLITTDQAMHVLMDEVIQSRAFARQEVERYTLKSPGQATSYLFGFIKMVSLRRDTERILAQKFNAQKFHDFILEQGILSPVQIRKAVEEHFIPSQF